jgi:ATP-dependent Clp protease ATP-binding subunit ClpB
MDGCGMPSGFRDTGRKETIMDFEKYTERSRGFLQSGQTLALREGHQRFTPLHVLKVLLDDEEGLASGLIQAAGGDSRKALRAISGAR